MRAVLAVACAAITLLGSAAGAFAQPPPDGPVVVSSTYWGGTLDEAIGAAVVDAAGNLYVAGSTRSADFPKTVSALPALGWDDVFVSKFDASGALVFSTVFGGSSSDLVRGIAVDGSGHIIVVGDTFSSDLPMVNPIQPAFHVGGCSEFGSICADGFAVKLDPSGTSIVYSTYLGSVRLDNVLDVAVDPGGNAYVVGATESATFDGATPLRAFAGSRDAFIAKIPPAGGGFAYFTYLGGNIEDTGHGIAVDPAGNAYVTGVTGGQNFPTVNPIQASPGNFSTSAFVTKLDTSGAIAYSTYLGGHSFDMAYDVAVTALGEAIVAGVTMSTNFPTVNAQQAFLRGTNDVFVAKLSAAGSRLEYSTYLGGNDREQRVIDFSQHVEIAIDSAGNAYVSGTTQSLDFPAVHPLQPFSGGVCFMLPFEFDLCPDAFITKLDRHGRLAFSSPIGGGSEDLARGVAVAGNGVVHVFGTTRSVDFPVRDPLQPALSGDTDAFITTIATAPPACQLPPPVQVSPAGGISDAMPTFSWQPVPGAEAYAVLIRSTAADILTGTAPDFFLGASTTTSLTLPAALPAGDFTWLVVPWNASCGFGRRSNGLAFTLPGSCPAPTATNLTPANGAVVPNPTRLTWAVSGPSPATLSIVVVFEADGSFVGLYPTASTDFTLPITLSTDDYVWFVLTWNSTCGISSSAPQTFRSTGTVVP